MDAYATLWNLDIRTLAVIFLVFITTYLCMYSRDKQYALPPGPFVLPFIGTAYALAGSMEGFVAVAKQYGDAMTLYAGHIRIVVLNTYDVIKEAAVTKANDFSDRGVHVSFTAHRVNPNMKGVIGSDYDDNLRRNRSQTLTILRNLGVGRSTMEGKILEEVGALRKVFAAKSGAAFDPHHIVTCAVANVILYVTFSRRHEHDDPELLAIVRHTHDVIGAAHHMALIDTCPALRHVPPYRQTYARLLAAEAAMRDYMWKYAQRQMHHFRFSEAANYVHYWLDRNYSETDKRPVFDEENFLYILRDFLIAGSETTTTSLKWTMIVAANRPEVQEKVHDEIQRVIGKDRPVRLSDREHLPYLEAFIWEVQRLCTIVPVGLPHFTYLDAKIGSYDIPANTMVVFNLHAVHMNPDVFVDPHVFRPERFLDDGGRFVKHPHVIPFAIDKRSCLGELLARQELFLFTASLLQNFQFLPPEGVDKIEDKGTVGFTHCPKPFTIRALPR